MDMIAVYLKCSDQPTETTLKSFVELIRTLGSGAEVTILTTQQPPEGCAISTVSAKCEVHMMLKVGHHDDSVCVGVTTFKLLQ